MKKILQTLFSFIFKHRLIRQMLAMILKYDIINRPIRWIFKKHPGLRAIFIKQIQGYHLQKESETLSLNWLTTIPLSSNSQRYAHQLNQLLKQHPKN